jgi:ketosteroid isomerase-like protein
VSQSAGRRSNEELLREGFLAFSEGRYEDALRIIDPEIEWHITFRLPDLPFDQPVIYGHEQVLELWRQFGSVWGRLVFTPQDLLHDEGDTVIARTRIQATGGESGVPLDTTIFYVITIRDGLLRRIQPFESLDDAAAAAGVDPREL